MTVSLFALLFNLSAIGAVLVASLFLQRHYAGTFFPTWTRAYFFGAVVVVVMEVLGAQVGRPALLVLAEAAAIFSCTWYYFQTAIKLGARNRPIPEGWMLPGAAIWVAYAAAMMALRVPFELISALPVVAMCLAICWLGITLVRRERPATAFNMSWLGAPVIGMGLWPLSFPVLERTPVFWVGGWVAGLLHLTVGFGMALVLVNESAATVRQQNEELRALDRMKGNFLSMVSHELRTPLMALTGYLELLADGFAGPVNPDQREYIANIEAASLQLSSLVESLLDTMQAEVGTLRVQREETDPMVILDRTVASMRVIAAKRGIVVETIRPGNLPPIVADAERVGQILSNIIGNSLKFSEKGTSITVAANVEGGQLVVRISDQGIGVPQEALELIFQPFYQVDNTLTRVRGGTGLGLAISRSLAQAMDGKLVAESTPGVGTTFTLSLPLSEVESLAAEPVAVSAT